MPADVGLEDFEEPVEIGRGGFGVVYRAYQPEFDRFVAIKVLSGLRDERARRRFDRERRSIGKLSGHPNIVTVHASGFTGDGSPYLVMEYLSGGSLAERLQHGPVPWPEAFEIGTKLASALQAAHDAGVLHRDIKAENVLVSDRGEPKLADFGIAVLQGGTETTSGFTPVHAAPEVLAGQAASPAADVYSLGSMLYALVAGHAAFWRDSDESVYPLMARIANEAVPDLRPVGVPDPVCVLLEQAMAKDPAQRLGPAAELARQCATLVSDRGHAHTLVAPPPPPPPPPTGPITPPRRARRRRKQAKPPAPVPGLIATPPPLENAAATGEAPASPPSAPPIARTPPAGPLAAPPPRRRGGSRRRLLWVLGGLVGIIIVAVIAVLAFSGGGGKKSTSTTNAHDLAVAQKSCTLVDPTDFAAVFGRPPGPGRPDGDTGFCDLANAVSVQIFDEHATASDFQSLRQGVVGARDVPNLGGGAYFDGSFLNVFDPKRSISFELFSLGSTTEQQLIDLAQRTLARG
jgi:serine/threonine-protein kinase PknK